MFVEISMGIYTETPGWARVRWPTDNDFDDLGERDIWSENL